MGDLLWTAYPWIKAVHIMAVIAWMAGLFYLPRLFVYHVEQVGRDGDTARLFQTMEERLLRVIMTPAMLASWALGLVLVTTPGLIDWALTWPWLKLSGILAMTAFHIWLARQRRTLMHGGPALSGRQYRMANEIPTVLMVLIVLSVVVKF